MFEQKESFIPPEACIPAQEAIAAAGHEWCEVMFAEVDVVVRGNKRRMHGLFRGSEIQTLAGVEARAILCGGG